MSSLKEILEVPESYRDPNWENQFFDAFLQAEVEILNEQPIEGPDGMAYLMVKTTDDAGEPVSNVIEWLNEKGIGLVVNPKDPYPDYVFSWGMVWSYKSYGRFVLPMEQHDTGEFEISENSPIHSEPPSEEYLPTYVRAIIKDFFNQQEIETPRILVILVEGQKQADLCLSIESLGDPPEEEHDDICQALSWFLPAHYSIVIMREQGLPFVDL